MVQASVELPPGGCEFAAVCEICWEPWVQLGQAGCQDTPVDLGEQHCYAAAQRGELVAVVARQPDDEPLAFESTQVVGGLAAGVGAAEQGGDGPGQGWVVEPGEQVGSLLIVIASPHPRSSRVLNRGHSSWLTPTIRSRTTQAHPHGQKGPIVTALRLRSWIAVPGRNR
jgi:hypothetical protein